MKRIVLCCDGTWNQPDQTRGDAICPTNVTRFAEAVTSNAGDGVPQCVFYEPGVGVRPDQRISGGVFGYGLERNVRNVYRYLVESYEPGDGLFFVGFSRGAYTARSAAAMVRNCGILRQEHAGHLDDAYEFYRSRDPRTAPREAAARLFRRTYSHQPDLRIRFLGVWDTVGSRGIPLQGPAWARLVNRRWGFHDMALSATVDNAFQALAIDESRPPFQPALWDAQTPDPKHPQRVEQVWFPGDHCDVGGGHPMLSAKAGRKPTGRLSDVTLLWMIDRAHESGLEFDADALTLLKPGDPPSGGPDDLYPDWSAPIHNSQRWFYRPLGRGTRTIGAKFKEFVASTAMGRYNDAAQNYRPRNLATYLNANKTAPLPVELTWPPGRDS